MLRPDPPDPPGSTCFTLPKYLICRSNLAKNVLWHIVELSQTIVTCLRALVMATFIRLLSPKNPTAPRLFERTWDNKYHKFCTPSTSNSFYLHLLHLYWCTIGTKVKVQLPSQQGGALINMYTHISYRLVGGKEVLTVLS